MQWVHFRVRARRPSAGRDAWWFAQVIRSLGSEGKVGKNPSLIKRLEKGKSTKKSLQDVGA